MKLRFSIDDRKAELLRPEFKFICELARPVFRDDTRSWEGSALLTVANVNQVLSNLNRLGAWVFASEKDVMKQVFNEALYQLSMFNKVRLESEIHPLSVENVSSPFFNRSFGLCDSQRI